MNVRKFNLLYWLDLGFVKFLHPSEFWHKWVSKTSLILGIITLVYMVHLYSWMIIPALALGLFELYDKSIQHLLFDSDFCPNCGRMKRRHSFSDVKRNGKPICTECVKGRGEIHAAFDRMDDSIKSLREGISLRFGKGGNYPTVMPPVIPDSEVQGQEQQDDEQK